MSNELPQMEKDRQKAQREMERLMRTGNEKSNRRQEVKLFGKKVEMVVKKAPL